MAPATEDLVEVPGPTNREPCIGFAKLEIETWDTSFIDADAILLSSSIESVLEEVRNGMVATVKADVGNIWLVSDRLLENAVLSIGLVAADASSAEDDIDRWVGLGELLLSSYWSPDNKLGRALLLDSVSKVNNDELIG